MKHPIQHRPRAHLNLVFGSQVQGAKHWTMPATHRCGGLWVEKYRVNFQFLNILSDDIGWMQMKFLPKSLGVYSEVPLAQRCNVEHFATERMAKKYDTFQCIYSTVVF